MAFVRKIRSPKLREERRKRALDMGAVWVALFGALLLLTSQVARIPSLLVASVTIENTGAVSEHDIRTVVASATAGSYALIAPKTNVFVYPRASIRGALTQKFPRIVSVSVQTPDTTHAKIVITERVPAGVWCGTERTSESEECFFLDKTGFLYSRAPQFTSSPFFAYYGELSKTVTESNPIGLYFLSQNILEEFKLFTDELTTLGMIPRALVHIDDYFELIDEGGARIIFSEAEGYAGTLENIRAILGSGEFENDIGGKLLSVDYIDLRFGNKVFYKLSN